MKAPKLMLVHGGAAQGKTGPEVDDDAIVIGLRAREAWAERAFLERCTSHVERILTRILGGIATSTTWCRRFSCARSSA